ncbi:MAG TPA: hypothetical protein VKA67_00990, partial [Verrucomicrobiae bacterium]|nr:hypothetical protein [Verrucomicrobiae bacterium]
ADVGRELFALTASSAVRLTIELSGAAALISWPMSASNFVLQTTTNFGPPVITLWDNDTNTPTVVGANYVVTNLTRGESQRFYRLQKK